MILDLFKLDGKVALVTGAGQGLGQGMALALAEAGADIASLDRTGCQGTCEAVRGLGRRYHEFVLDLREASVDDLRKVVEKIAGELGGVARLASLRLHAWRDHPLVTCWQVVMINRGSIPKVRAPSDGMKPWARRALPSAGLR